MTAAIEVNECRVFATQLGVDWWLTFRSVSERAGRITTLVPSPAGELVSVACDSADDAQWLAGRMVEQGLPKSAVKIKTVRGGAS